MKKSILSMVKINPMKFNRGSSQFGCLVVGLSILFLIGMAEEAKADYLFFNGLDSYVEIWDSPQLGGGLGRSLTVEAWVFPTDFPTKAPIISKYKDWNTKDWGLVIEEEGLIGFGHERWDLSECRGGERVWSSEVISLSEWNHVAFVFDNDNNVGNVYINGVLKGSGVFKCDLPDSIAFVWIGGRGPYYWAHHDPGIFSGILMKCVFGKSHEQKAKYWRICYLAR